MRFARLFTPLVLAAALVAPATMSTAHAALPDSRMTYTPAKAFASPRVVIQKSQRLVLTSLVNARDSAETHQFTVFKGATSKTSDALAFGQSYAFTLWQTAGTGTFTIIESNGQQAVAGTIEVIDG